MRSRQFDAAGGVTKITGLIDTGGAILLSSKEPFFMTKLATGQYRVYFPTLRAILGAAGTTYGPGYFMASQHIQPNIVTFYIQIASGAYADGGAMFEVTGLPKI